MLFTKYSVGSISMVLLLASMPKVAADEYSYQRCFCETPDRLLAAHVYNYHSDRLQYDFEWYGKGKGLADEKLKSVGQICKDPDDKSTCHDVPSAGASGLTGRKKGSIGFKKNVLRVRCTRRKIDGKTHEVCGHAGNDGKVSLDGEEETVEVRHRGLKPASNSECKATCKRLYPEEEAVRGICAITNKQGENVPVGLEVDKDGNKYLDECSCINQEFEHIREL